MTTIAVPTGASSLTSLRHDGTNAYAIDAHIDSVVDSTVANCWAQGESLDDTIEVVAALVRTTAPTGFAESDPEWESRWRCYFAFYDHAVMHGIRSYVERAHPAG